MPETAYLTIMTDKNFLLTFSSLWRP